MQDIVCRRGQAAAMVADIQPWRSPNTGPWRLFAALLVSAVIPLAHAGDNDTSQPLTGWTNALPPAASAPGGRQMPRYQLLARQAAVPVQEVNSTLRVGDQLTIDLGARAPLTREQTASLASVLGVPEKLVARTFANVTNQPPPEPHQFAQQIRMAVIDYKFLTGEWNRYQPQGDQQQVKAKALELLQAGELAKAWDLYDALPRPQAPAAPSNLRILGP